MRRTSSPRLAPRAVSTPISSTSRVAAIANTPSLKVSSLVVSLTPTMCVKLTHAVDGGSPASPDHVRARDRGGGPDREPDGFVLARPAGVLRRDGRRPSARRTHPRPGRQGGL